MINLPCFFFCCFLFFFVRFFSQKIRTLKIHEYAYELNELNTGSDIINLLCIPRLFKMV